VLDSTLLLKRLSSVNDEDDRNLRTIVFSLANIEDSAMSQYLFAMPVEAVEKSIVYPVERAQLKDGIGMINLGDRMLTIVDLRQKFTTVAPERDDSRFLILFHTQAGELCGLPVKDAPVLLDIAPDTIRQLPLAYREVNQIGFATHMATIPQAEGAAPLQILLMGLDRVLAKLGNIQPVRSLTSASELN
jgi:chemotaxis signal transduction protein